MEIYEYILIFGYIALIITACIFNKSKKPIHHNEFKNPSDDRFDR